MDVIPLLVLCSLALSAIGVLLFIASTRNQDHEHADRLALLPLEEDLPPSAIPPRVLPSNERVEAPIPSKQRPKTEAR